MKNKKEPRGLPFENSKHRLAWKIILHIIQVLLYPIAPIITACVVFDLFNKRTVSRIQLVTVLLVVLATVFIVNFFVGKIRNLPETSDNRRRLKYTSVGVLDSLPWIGCAVLVVLMFGTMKNVCNEINATVDSVYGIFFKMMIVISSLAFCKLLVIWLNALCIKFLDAVDNDAERGYLLEKAYKHNGKDL